MKIGIDARSLTTENKAGIGIYTNEIINNINSEVLLISHKKINKNNNFKRDSIKTKTIQFPFYRWKIEKFWENTVLISLANQSNIDIYWGPRFFIPPRLKIKSVATIHDIAFTKFPNIVSKKQFKYFDSLIRSSVKNSDHFISVSETTKIDFCEYYNVNPEKVSVIFNGFNKYFSTKIPEYEILQVKNTFRITGDFILFLGTLEPRKNLARLIKAYLNSNAFKLKIPLVLAGKMGWLQKDLMKTINPLINSGDIILTGYLNIKQLKALYESCMFFAFPSIYEGFGIPVLEAMASGAAILTSNNSSLGELFAKTAHLVDPFSIDSIAEGIDKLLDCDYRDQLVKNSQLYINQFSWQTSAHQHNNLFTKLINCC